MSCIPLMAMKMQCQLRKLGAENNKLSSRWSKCQRTTAKVSYRVSHPHTVCFNGEKRDINTHAALSDHIVHHFWPSSQAQQHGSQHADTSPAPHVISNKRQCVSWTIQLHVTTNTHQFLQQMFTFCALCRSSVLENSLKHAHFSQVKFHKMVTSTLKWKRS